MGEGRKSFDWEEPLLFEKSVEGRLGMDFPMDELSLSIPQEQLKEALGGLMRSKEDRMILPEMSEPEVCRHFMRLSRWNYCIDSATYPLGSCTMKYNPKVNEWAARLPGFASLHPYLPTKRIQGALQLIFELQKMLCEIGGFEQVSLLPAAGAQGELVGVMMMQAYFKEKGEIRRRILIPQSAHGTNPATAAFCGLEVVQLSTGTDGRVVLKELLEKMDSQTAGMMLTNPNTLGIFEKDIVSIAEIVHGKGGLIYGDGANLNALLGVVKPGASGIDVMHFNLHKTFTTPHGGGGPGCGAVGAGALLESFLPAPVIQQLETGEYVGQVPAKAIGKVRGFYGNFGMMVRAWTYIREMGAKGLKQATERAVLNANYIKSRLSPCFDLPYHEDCLHEVVFSDRKQRSNQVSTIDIAKRLIDFGIHPPTVYFPLVVSGAMMIEPTETESKQELDRLCDALIQIAKESEENPEYCKKAPHSTAIQRVDEAMAARHPILRWLPQDA